MADERPASAPPGAGDLPGMIELYAEYERTAAAKAKNPTRATIDAHQAAMQALADGRQFWRQIREWTAAQAFRDWLAEQPDDVQAQWAQLEAAEQPDDIDAWMDANPAMAAEVARRVGAAQAAGGEG